MMMNFLPLLLLLMRTEEDGESVKLLNCCLLYYRFLQIPLFQKSRQMNYFEKELETILAHSYPYQYNNESEEEDSPAFLLR